MCLTPTLSFIIPTMLFRTQVLLLRRPLVRPVGRVVCGKLHPSTSFFGSPRLQFIVKLYYTRHFRHVLTGLVDRDTSHVELRACDFPPAVQRSSLEGTGGAWAELAGLSSSNSTEARNVVFSVEVPSREYSLLETQSRQSRHLSTYFLVFESNDIK